MVIMERDKEIIRLVYRFKFCTGRHIGSLVGFSGTRACDRRLTILVNAGYLSRRKYLYGVPYLYSVSHKGRILIGANKRDDKVRLEQINHDMIVLDMLIYFKDKYSFSLDDVISERELHIKDGFGTRKHQPDFVFTFEGKSYAVEVELTQKSKINLEKNVRDNYLGYDGQIWITDDTKVLSMIKAFFDVYSNIEIIGLEEIMCPVST